MNMVSFRLRGADGEPIRGDVHLPEDWREVSSEDSDCGSPTVLIVHGFKGFKDWGGWQPIADRFASEGLIAVRFDLSHNGVGEDGVDFSALEKFERNTYAKELQDIRTVTEGVDAGRVGVPAAAFGRVFLLGHSRGGGGVLLSAVRQAAGRVAGVITWASISDLGGAGWIEEHEAMWKRGESASIPNMRTKQIMPIGPEFYEDLVQNREAYRLDRALEELARRGTPLCVVHGTSDPSVPVAEAHRLRNWAERAGHRTFEYHEIAGADHTFGAVQPWKDWTPHLNEACEATLRFVKKYSGRK